MKKKKFVPKSEQSDDFVIFDLSTDLPDYTLAFHLNKKLKAHLERETDLKVYYSSPRNPETFSFYFCEQERERYMFLIHSLDGQQTLMKNYFLIFQGNFNKEELGQIISAIETIESVLNINEIKLLSTSKKVSAALKKKLALLNAILNDLEYHMIDVGRKRTEQTVQLKKKTGSIKKLYKG
jgi:hypothetical protein